MVQNMFGIMVPLKYLYHVLRTLELTLFNCEINLKRNWSESWVLVVTNVTAPSTTFSITDTKLYAPVVNLSTQDNAELLEQLKSSFKRKINLSFWSKFLRSKYNFCFCHLKMKRKESYKRYHLPAVEIKDSKVMIDGQNYFD